MWFQSYFSPLVIRYKSGIFLLICVKILNQNYTIIMIGSLVQPFRLLIRSKAFPWELMKTCYVIFFDTLYCMKHLTNVEYKMYMRWELIELCVVYSTWRTKERKSVSLGPRLHIWGFLLTAREENVQYINGKQTDVVVWTKKFIFLSAPTRNTAILLQTAWF